MTKFKLPLVALNILLASLYSISSY